MSIKPLPPQAADRIKSSAVITSLNAAACVLFTNALDAAATNINLSLDYARGNCTLDDDGQGIPPTEFYSEGGLGKPYHTSKYPPKDTCHGHAGNSLAFLATLALLSVSSHHRHFASHNALTIHKSTVLSRHTPAPPAQRFHAFPHGTRVAVHDLFGSMPVRVKQRAIFSSRSVVDREWNQLVRHVLAYLVAWPHAVSVSLSLHSSHVGNRHLRLRSSSAPGTSPPKVAQLLSQAALSDVTNFRSWIPVSVSISSVTISGFICTEPVATKRNQFFSLGIHPIANESGSNVLYEEVNRLFSNSSFASLVDGNANNTATKAKKSIDRWPMFCFSVRLRASSSSWSDILNSHQHQLSDIIKGLRLLCLGFLKTHGLVTQPSQPSNPTVNSVKSGLTKPSSPFAGWARTKPHKSSLSQSPKLNTSGDKRTITQALSVKETVLPSRKKQRLVTQDGQLAQAPFLDGSLEELEDSEGENINQHPPEPAHECKLECPPPSLQPITVGLASRISKEALATAHVLSQVDAKFIMAKLQQSCIILIDQHAADERVRLEELMSEYFYRHHQNGMYKAQTQKVDRPILFDISLPEAHRAQQLADHFGTWGIEYQVAIKATQSWSVLSVTTLPPSIFARCSQEPRLLIDLIRTEIWNKDEHTHVSRRMLDTCKDWASRFNGCPQGILDLLNSRACRSAIMFNDVLSHGECTALVKRLSQCAFPFQCAHGRPSMVPLVDLGRLNMASTQHKQ